MNLISKFQIGMAKEMETNNRQTGRNTLGVLLSISISLFFFQTFILIDKNTLKLLIYT